MQHKIIRLSGPSDLRVGSITSTSLTVDVVPPSGNPEVRFYDVSVEGASSSKKECGVKSTERPLRCVFSGLTPSTRYSIKAKACLKVSRDCGKYLEKFVSTLAV